MSTTHHAKPVDQAERLRKVQAEARALRQELRRGRQHASAALAEAETLRQQLRHVHRLASLGTVAAMVAHEFNNILTPIINYAHMAQKTPKYADKALARAVDGGLRAKEICQRMLGLTRENQEKTDENVLALVRDTLTAMARDPGKDGIELTLDIPADLHARTRRGELQQVLLNLLLNARHALQSRHGGEKHIRIAARREETTLVLSVSDSGPGVPDELHERIFEPFFSTKPGDDADTDGGHGLGLTICRDIITSLGGTISLQSPPRHGATFTLELPDE
ncbi:MAG: HAMP domain-containing histidine kinase [Phycisphaerae bacterium]|nr:HAMP domain-containing histidine kinase [Phycisphaerae bacterium]